MVATLFSYFLLTSIGRRKILISGSLISGISNIMIMIGYFFKDGYDFGVPILLVGIFLFIINFGLTLGPVTWIYIP